jgi:hypothetical protein
MPGKRCERSWLHKVRYAKVKLPRSTSCKFFEKSPNTSKKSHAHLQGVHKNYARFEDCQPKGVRGVDITQSRYPLEDAPHTHWQTSPHAAKMTKFNYMQISQKKFEHLQKVTCIFSMCSQLCKVWRMSAQRCERSWLHKVSYPIRRRPPWSTFTIP